MPSQMDVGTGLAQGAQNFFMMYNAEQDRKKQKKLEEIQPILAAINSRLQDKTINLDEKKRLIDKLQDVYNVAGIKVKIPKGQTLSSLILPDEFLNQIQETGEFETIDAVNAVPEGTSTDVITTSPTQIALTKRRGEMSDADVSIALERKARRGQNEDDLKRQKEFKLYEFGLNQQIMNNAYTKNPEEVVEPSTGRTWSVYTNANPSMPPIYKPLGAYRTERGELVVQPQEDTIPVSTFTARERAKASGGGLPSTMKALIFETSRELGLPADDERVLDTAAEKYREQYTARTNNLNLGTVKGQQATQGKEPIQPAEQQRFEFTQRQYKANLQGQIDETTETIQAADEEINTIQAQIDASQAEINRLLNEEKYLREDKEVKEVQDVLNRHIKEQNEAKKRKAAAEGKQNRYKKELQEFTQGSTISTSSSGGRSDIVNKAIQAFKNNPNNKARGADKMSDDEIEVILRRAGRIQ